MTIRNPSVAYPITIHRNFHYMYQVIGEIYFTTNDDKLDVQEQVVLEAICLELRGLSLRVGCFADILVVGGADHRGGGQFNKDLGQKRADAVKSFIEAKGFSSYKFCSQSTGEQRAAQPKPSHSVPKDRLAADRRVDILLSLSVNKGKIRKLEMQKKKIQELLMRTYQADMIDQLGALSIYAPGDYTIDNIIWAVDWVKPKSNTVGSAVLAAGKSPIVAVYIMVTTPVMLLTDTVVTIGELGRRMIGSSPPGTYIPVVKDQIFRVLLDEVSRDIRALSTCQVRVRR